MIVALAFLAVARCVMARCFDDIEMSPEMIKAGVSVLEISGRLSEGSLSSDDLLVQEVFRAMSAHCARKWRQPSKRKNLSLRKLR